MFPHPQEQQQKKVQLENDIQHLQDALVLMNNVHQIVKDHPDGAHRYQKSVQDSARAIKKFIAKVFQAVGLKDNEEKLSEEINTLQHLNAQLTSRNWSHYSRLQVLEAGHQRALDILRGDLQLELKAANDAIKNILHERAGLLTKIETLTEELTQYKTVNVRYLASTKEAPSNKADDHKIPLEGTTEAQTQAQTGEIPCEYPDSEDDFCTVPSEALSGDFSMVDKEELNDIS